MYEWDRGLANQFMRLNKHLFDKFEITDETNAGGFEEAYNL